MSSRKNFVNVVSCPIVKEPPLRADAAAWVVPGAGAEWRHSHFDQPLATVVITTRNRRDELRSAIASALAQTVPVEILVIDDGSCDGSPEMVNLEFPSVRLERSVVSRGCVAQRNRAAKLAKGQVIFSIDDDAIFVSPCTVEQTLSEFDDNRIGAVAIPYIEPRKSALVRQQVPANEGIFVTDSFIGTAHAVRRDLFLQVGGYRDCLVHQGEEMDFCLRLLEAGYVVRMGRGDPINHLESPRRDFRRMDFYGRRNDILFVWHNVPIQYLLLHAIATSINGIVSGIRVGRILSMLRGTLSGYANCVKRWKDRKPVDPTIYRLSRRLKKRGPQSLESVVRLLRPIE